MTEHSDLPRQRHVVRVFLPPTPEWPEPEYLADLRKTTIAAIWNAVQADPEATIAPIVLGPNIVLGSKNGGGLNACKVTIYALPGWDERIDLGEDLALAATRIIDADYDFGMVGGFESVQAYDLGDDFLYVVEAPKRRGRPFWQSYPRLSPSPSSARSSATGSKRSFGSAGSPRAYKCFIRTRYGFDAKRPDRSLATA
jgi:hypothetical protein